MTETEAKDKFNKELFEAISKLTNEGMEVSFRPMGTAEWVVDCVDIQVTARTIDGHIINRYFCDVGNYSLDVIPKVLERLKHEIEEHEKYPEKRHERWMGKFKTLSDQRKLEEENQQLRWYRDNCGVEKELAEKVSEAVHKIVFDAIKEKEG